MSHLGASTSIGISSVDGAGNQIGCSVITAANGDELWSQISGEAQVVLDPTNTFPIRVDLSGDVVYDGGTGRFQNATGSGTYSGSFDFFTQVGHLEESGTISR